MAREGIRYSGPIDVDGKLHRFQVDDDPRGRKNGWYVLHLDSQSAGMFGCNKRYGDHRFSWKAEGAKPLTPEERQALSRKIAEAKAKREADEAARHAAAAAHAEAAWTSGSPANQHPYLAKKGVPSHGLRVGVWKKPRPDGSFYTVAADALLIPLYGPGKVIRSLQAIFSAPVMIGGEERSKDFVYGGEKIGLYYPIGQPTEVNGQVTFCLAEGYATAASIHEATGLATLVCFDAGNLVHVGRTFRKAFPAARIIVCADNDQWTMIRGEAVNVGVQKAAEAAKTINGLVATPWFSNVNTKPTDFNDLHLLEGTSAVARQIFSTFRKVEEPPPAEEEPPPWDEASMAAGGALQVIDGGKSATAPDKKKRGKGEDRTADPESMRENAWFRVLGHDRENIYVFQSEMRMVICRKYTDWGRNAFLMLANMAWWQQNFPGGGKDGFDTGMATNALIRIANECGFYDPTRTRGRGAWQDRGRIVIHFGGSLLVDGIETAVTDIESNFVYEQGRHLNIPPETPMSGADGARIIKVSQTFHWTRPASAILLAGWVALAPICGALRWRPHIWLTGGTGSGKSSALNLFVWWLMDGMEIYAQGNSTEAGIRQTLQIDALPVLFDESEQNDDRERFRVQSILALIRQASTESGAKTLKGTQFGSSQGYMIRSMFCLASVQVGMQHQADFERITVLSLRPKRVDSNDQAAKNWATIKGAIDDLRADPELPGRLLRRSITLLPITIQNIETFAKVASDKFGSQREGDQYGAMLAGAWSLVRSTIATEDEAREMMARYDWTEYLENSETEESMKALNTLMERLIRTPKGDVSVYELVARAAGLEGEGAYDGHRKDAEAIIRRHGMGIKWVTNRIEDAALLIAHRHSGLDELMADTPYASDVKGQLGRVPGAFRHEPTRFNGTLSRATAIPLPRVLVGARGEPEAQPIDPGDPFGDSF